MLISFFFTLVVVFVTVHQQDYNDDIRQEQLWEMQILKERSSNSSLLSDGLGIHLLETTIPLVQTAKETPSPTSTNSKRSQSPHAPPSTVLDRMGSSSTLPASHPPSREFALQSSLPVLTPPSRTISGRKRPLLTNTTRHSMGPTKRTIMGILTYVRAAQAKQIPGYHVSG